MQEKLVSTLSFHACFLLFGIIAVMLLTRKHPIARKVSFLHVHLYSYCFASSIRNEANVCCILCSPILGF